MRKQNGYTLFELVAVMAILSLFLFATVTITRSAGERMQLFTTAHEVKSTLQRARERAKAMGVNVAVRFSPHLDGWRIQTFEDGDRDGVLNADITAGIDRAVGVPSMLAGTSRMTLAINTIQFRTRNDASGIRFNRSSLCSFSPRGEGTSGSVVMRSPGGRSARVIVYGPAGSIRVKME